MNARLSAVGEVGAIRRLARWCGRGRGVRTGIGDDCAVVVVAGSRWDWLLTSDPVIEGTHFLPSAPPRRIGHKAVGRVLSDLGAMGGEPLWILLDVVAPRATPLRRLEEVYRGATALASRHGAAIVGGDLARGERLELHAFAVGRCPRGRAVLRSGARPGDAIYVTGALGGSLAGRHLAFPPRVREGRWLAAGRWARAMMDVSDGLAADLPRLLDRSGAGAVLDLPAVPVSRAARRAAARSGRRPLDHALGDGEDFELLFAVPARRAAAFERAWRRAFRLRCTRVGRVTRDRGRLLAADAAGRLSPLGPGGYEHFVDPGAGAHTSQSVSPSR